MRTTCSRCRLLLTAVARLRQPPQQQYCQLSAFASKHRPFYTSSSISMPTFLGRNHERKQKTRSFDVLRTYSTSKSRSTEEMYGQKKFEKAGYPLLLIPIITFCLGCWQVQRRQWKLGLIAQMQDKLTAPPVDLPDDLSRDLSDYEYSRVRVRGRFDHTREIIVKPRTLVDHDYQPGGGGSLAGNSAIHGAHVVTPFILSDRKGVILVNRGWVHTNDIDVRQRQAGQVEGDVELSGVLRLTEKKPTFVPENDPEKERYFYRDVEAMARSRHTLPVYIELDEESAVEGGPIGGQTRAKLFNEHMNYIITWWSLSAITSFMWLRRYVLRP